MFLQKYVQEVDEQLARLIAARDKIASLAGPAPDFKYEASLPSLAAAHDQQAAPEALNPSEPEPTQSEAAPAKRRGRPKGSKNKTTMIRTRRQAVPEPRALSSAVPVGPVVVSPAQLARRHEPAAQKPEARAPEPEQSSGGLDALIRELGERRAPVFSPAA